MLAEVFGARPSDLEEILKPTGRAELERGGAVTGEILHGRVGVARLDRGAISYLSRRSKEDITKIFLTSTF